MTKRTSKEDSTQESLVGRRDYLRLAGAAGVASVGVSALSGTASARLSRTLTIEGSGTRADYDFSVSGEVTKSTAMGASISDEDTISGQDVSGAVSSGGQDSYAFTGQLTSFSMTGDPYLYLNGEPLADTLTVEDIDEDKRTNYEIRVDGEVLKSPAMAATIDENDEITPRNNPGSVDPEMTGEEALGGETYVFAGVNEYKDSYAVSGEITGFHADGNVNVYLNEELVDEPAQFVRNTLTFESTDGTGAGYEFTVSRDVAKSTWMDASINDNDIVDRGTVTGGVSSGRDSYVFTGEVSSFTGESNLRVYLNGEEIDAAALNREPQFENTLTIDGGGGRTEYRLVVEGDLAENYGLSDEDSIDGKVADGAVGGGQESYTFSGDISKFEYDTTGAFTTILNGQEVDPEVLGRTTTPPETGDLPNEVTVTGLGSGRKEYGVSVTGQIRPGRTSDTSSDDDSSASFARGAVGSGSDVYGCSGEVESVTDYDTFQIDVDRRNQLISIENFDGSRTEYEVTVTGTLTGKATSGEDSISGGTATGAVGGGTDSYEFTGELLTVTVEGVMEVDVDFNERPLIGRELAELKTTFQQSDQLSVVESAIVDDGFSHNLGGAIGTSKIHPDEADFQPPEPEGKVLSIPVDNTGSTNAQVNSYAFFPKNSSDIKLVSLISDDRGYLGKVHTNNEILDKEENGYVV